MSVGLYDTSIINKFKFWMSDSKISIADPDTLFSYRADAEGTDSIQLPVVSLTRGPIQIVRTGKSPMSKDGFKYISDNKKLSQLRAIPIRIAYQVDVITRKRQQNDDLLRELIFKLVNNPKLEVEIPYKDCPFTHYFTLTLQDDIEDNSDISQHLEKGEYFRTTLNIEVEDAYLFNYQTKDKLDLEIDIQENNN